LGSSGHRSGSRGHRPGLDAADDLDQPVPVDELYRLACGEGPGFLGAVS
jgi:hypothetical protein